MDRKTGAIELAEKVLELEWKICVRRDRERKYLEMIDDAVDGIYEIDRNGRFTQVNAAFLRESDYAPEEVIGRSYDKFVYPDDRPLIDKMFKLALEQRQSFIRGLKFRVGTRSGDIAWAEVNSHRHFDAEGNYPRAEGVLRDISRNRLIEDQPVRSERMAATSHLRKNGVRLDLELDPGLSRVLASSQQIGQVIINLVNNSVDAFNHAEIAGRQSAPAGVVVRTCWDDGKVIAEVADNGPEIDKDNLKHVFEMFYANKKTEGMGIGLSPCRTIIQRNNGWIEACNLDSGGAIFRFALPVANFGGADEALQDFAG